MATDFWPAGTGTGTYQTAMLLYQTGDRTYSFNQAHNHYLQLATEGGIQDLRVAAAADHIGFTVWHAGLGAGDVRIAALGPGCCEVPSGPASEYVGKAATYDVVVTSLPGGPVTSESGLAGVVVKVSGSGARSSGLVAFSAPMVLPILWKLSPPFSMRVFALRRASPHRARSLTRPPRRGNFRVLYRACSSGG